MQKDILTNEDDIFCSTCGVYMILPSTLYSMVLRVSKIEWFHNLDNAIKAVKSLKSILIPLLKT